MTFCRATLWVLLSVFAISPVQAELMATNLWSRATAPSAQTGVVYGGLHNIGKEPLTIIRVESTVAENVQIHRSTSGDGMMGMEQIPRVSLVPGQELRLEPGGMHIMLVGLKKRLEQGRTFEIDILAEKPLSEDSMPQNSRSKKSMSRKVTLTAEVMVGTIGQMEPPDTAAFHHNIAGIYRRMGRLKEAEHEFREAIRLKPDYGEAYQGLAEMVKFERHDPLLDQVLTQLKRSGLDKSVRCYFHFAAGKIYDDIGEYALAFKHYTQGNKDANKEFDSADFRRQVKDTIYVYSREYLKSIAGSGHDSRQPRGFWNIVTWSLKMPV